MEIKQTWRAMIEFGTHREILSFKAENAKEANKIAKMLGCTYYRLAPVK